MAFKSRAQERKFRSMLNKGEISQEIFDEWKNASKPYSQLPERIHLQPLTVRDCNLEAFGKCVFGISRGRNTYCHNEYRHCHGYSCESFDKGECIECRMLK